MLDLKYIRKIFVISELRSPNNVTQHRFYAHFSERINDCI